MEIEWNNLKNWFDVSCLLSDWLECTFLVSGKCNFISATLPKLSTHVGPLVCSVDMGFSKHRPMLVRGLYSSWERWWADGYGLSLTVVAHAEFGGVTSAIHLIVYRGVDAPCSIPHGALAQTLGQVMNPATKINAAQLKPSQIDPPAAVPAPTPWALIVVNGLLRCKGLYDIFHPKIDISCRSMFSPSKWVQRLPSAENFFGYLTFCLGLRPSLSRISIVIPS